MTGRAPDERAPAEDAAESAPPDDEAAPTNTEAAPAEAATAAVDDEPADNTPPGDEGVEDAAQSSPVADEPAEDAAPASPRETLLARLRETDDAAGLIDAFLTGREYFERGDNRRAALELQSILERSPSPELRTEVEALLRRIRPDRVALYVLAACVAGLILIWLLAVGASH